MSAMVDVHANPILHATFQRAKLGVWDTIDAGLSAVTDAGDVGEGIISGEYDFLVPLVMIGAIAFALSEGD